MKQLLLIRHGKSDWDHPGLSDHDRPLNERGRRDAPRVALALLERGVKADLIVSSTAVRAAATAALVADEMGYPREKIIEISDLYLASPQAILRAIQQLDEDTRTVLIFGHNPGMHEAVGLFSNGEEVQDFPTLAVGRIELAVEFWGEADWDSGRLLELLIPRTLNS